MAPESSPPITPAALAEQVEDLTDQIADLEARVHHIEAQHDSPTPNSETHHSQQDDSDCQRTTSEQTLAALEFKGVDGPADAAAPNIFIAGIPLGQMVASHGEALERIQQSINEHRQIVREDLATEADTRGKEDGKIRRRLAQCEDAVDIDPATALTMAKGGAEARHCSKLERFIRYGPEAVTDGRVYPVHRRAHEIAVHLGEWGTKINDAYGKRIRLRSKRDNLKTHLEAAFDQTFQWGEIYRAMEKLDEIAEDSNLTLKDGRHDEGKYVFELRVSDGRGPSFANSTHR